MNELHLLEEAKSVYSKLGAAKPQQQFSTLLRKLIESYKSILDAIYLEASESEAGRRWYKNMVEKRSLLVFDIKEGDMKKLLNKFDYSLPQNKLVIAAKLYLDEVTKIIYSGLGRYISG